MTNRTPVSRRRSPIRFISASIEESVKHAGEEYYDGERLAFIANTLPQLCVLGLRLLQQRKVRIRGLPDFEERLVRPGGGISLLGDDKRSRALKVRDDADGIRSDEIRMIEDLLELSSGAYAVAFGQICESSHVGWIQRPKVSMQRNTRRGEFRRCRVLQHVDRSRRRAALQGDETTKDRQVA